MKTANSSIKFLRGNPASRSPPRLALSKNYGNYERYQIRLRTGD